MTPAGHPWPPRKGDWRGTFTGGKFWPLDPRIEDVRFEDIAHHLALANRYGGATRTSYSVAEHSVIVSLYVPPEFAREALMHDAAEAYIGDMVRPLKHQPEMAEFCRAEDRIMPVIFRAFGVTSTPESRAAISEVDDRIVIDETDALVANPKRYRDRYPDVLPLGCAIAALRWEHAEHVFWQRGIELGLVVP